MPAMSGSARCSTMMMSGIWAAHMAIASSPWLASTMAISGPSRILRATFLMTVDPVDNHAALHARHPSRRLPAMQWRLRLALRVMANGKHALQNERANVGFNSSIAFPAAAPGCWPALLSAVQHNSPRPTRPDRNVLMADLARQKQGVLN